MIANPKRIARSYIRAAKMLIIGSALFTLLALLDITIGIGWHFKIGDFLGSLGFLVASIFILIFGKAYFRWIGALREEGPAHPSNDH